VAFILTSIRSKSWYHGGWVGPLSKIGRFGGRTWTVVAERCLVSFDQEWGSNVRVGWRASNVWRINWGERRSGPGRGPDRPEAITGDEPRMSERYELISYKSSTASPVKRHGFAIALGERVGSVRRRPGIAEGG